MVYKGMMSTIGPVQAAAQQTNVGKQKEETESQGRTTVISSVLHSQACYVGVSYTPSQTAIHDESDVPVQTLFETLTLRRTAPAYTPLPLLLPSRKSKLLADSFWRERSLHILLIAEDKEGDARELFLGQHGKEF